MEGYLLYLSTPVAKEPEHCMGGGGGATVVVPGVLSTARENPRERMIHVSCFDCSCRLPLAEVYRLFYQYS
jgi:hypothetical protein